MNLLDALHAELGDDRVLPQPGWATATRPGTFTPVAVMLHWTASFSSPRNPCPTLDVVRFGRAGLPGPLYAMLCGHDGRLRLVHRRLGNHAGAGSVAAVRLAEQGRVPHAYRPGPDDATLNRLAWGVALDYHPDQGPVPAAMLDCAVRAVAAIHRFQGWDRARVRAFDHRHATRRKRDNDVVADFRPLVAARLAGAPPAELSDPIEELAEMTPAQRQTLIAEIAHATAEKVRGADAHGDPPLPIVARLYNADVQSAQARDEVRGLRGLVDRIAAKLGA